MRVGVTVFAALALIACDKSHNAKDSESAPVSASDYPDRLTEAIYELDMRCCQRAGLIRSEPSDEPWPEARAKFDAKVAAQCLAQTARMPCPLEKGDLESFQPPVCRKVYTGTVALGEPCFTPWDCAPSDQSDEYIGCPLGLGASSSVCTRVFQRKAGESCRLVRTHSDELDCAPPLLCDDQKGVCVPRAKLGERCLTSADWGDTCAPGAMCDRTGTKRCVKPTPVGQPCDTIEDCESLACVDGLCREPLSILPLCEPD
jgi:hypothetical protein